MEENFEGTNRVRICLGCGNPLDLDKHGNRKYHQDCGSEIKKQRQKKKYQIGNYAKLLIQKNEAVAERLHTLDNQKKGIPYMRAMAEGFKFDCPTTIRIHHKKKVYMLYRYGYLIEQHDSETLIFIFHESELV